MHALSGDQSLDWIRFVNPVLVAVHSSSDLREDVGRLLLEFHLEFVWSSAYMYVLQVVFDRAAGVSPLGIGRAARSTFCFLDYVAHL